jgi:hypothetical protein
MKAARRRVLRVLACIAASLSARGVAALESRRAAAASSPGSAASSPVSTKMSPPPSRDVNMPAVAPPPALLGARAFLLTGRDEPAGFGGYGYLLLLAPPRDDERARHLSVLAAWLRQYPTVEEFLKNKVQPREISLVQLPVRYEPQLSLRPHAASDAALRAAADQLLEAYDHSRAQAIATRLSLHIAGTGPVLVTLTRPAGAGTAGAALVENMSGVAPEIVEAWLRAAMQAALEPRAWSADALARLALRMRNVVEHLASTLPNPAFRADERVQLAQLTPR